MIYAEQREKPDLVMSVSFTSLSDGFNLCPGNIIIIREIFQDGQNLSGF